MAYDRGASEYLLEMLSCALNETALRKKPDEVSWANIYTLANRHSVSALAFYALTQAEEKPDSRILKNWDDKYNKILVKSSNQLYELERICKAFSEEKIPHMPLKGSCLRKFMAHFELREMTDLDILVPCDLIERATEIMLSLGYEYDGDNGNHVTFKKLPYMYVELHRELLDSKYEFYPIFEQPWKYAKPTEDAYRYVLSDEDFYLYNLAHSAKHYYYKGTGIRSVMDIYLLRKALAEKLDWEYVERRNTVPLLSEFKEQIESLADQWFSPTAQERICENEMTHYILSGSTYGSHDGNDRRMVRKYMENGKSIQGAKRSYFFRMVFLPRSEMQLMYPMLRKAPVMLPFCWCARWFTILLRKPKNVKKRIRQVKNIDVFTKEQK